MPRIIVTCLAISRFIIGCRKQKQSLHPHPSSQQMIILFSTLGQSQHQQASTPTQNSHQFAASSCKFSIDNNGPAREEYHQQKLQRLRIQSQLKVIGTGTTRHDMPNYTYLRLPRHSFCCNNNRVLLTSSSPTTSSSQPTADKPRHLIKLTLIPLISGSRVQSEMEQSPHQQQRPAQYDDANDRVPITENVH